MKRSSGPETASCRSQKLEIRVLVLERKETWTDVAVLTLLRRTDDAITSNVGAVTGALGQTRTSPRMRLT